MFKYSKKYKAYSLLELVVSLAIVGIVTVVMMQFMIMSFRISAIILGRSLVREELATLMNSVGRDFKNSDFAPSCSENGTACDFSIEGVSYKWYLCNGNSICKDKFNRATGAYVNLYTLSDNVVISYFAFSSGFSEIGTTGNTNIILTINAAHSNESLGINNVVRQSSYSLRNYEL